MTKKKENKLKPVKTAGQAAKEMTVVEMQEKINQDKKKRADECLAAVSEVFQKFNCSPDPLAQMNLGGKTVVVRASDFFSESKVKIILSAVAL